MRFIILIIIIGWIAKKDEPYPGKNGKPVMKTGEYYNMKLARPTGLEPRKAVNFGNKIIDEKVHPQKDIRKAIKIAALIEKNDSQIKI